MLPKPEKHVFVCTQHREKGHPFGSCSEMSAADVLSFFQEAQKASGLDGRVQVTETGCLGGPCAEGVTVVVYPEAVKYNAVRTREDVAEIFESHLIGGDPVARFKICREGWE